jgi:hypothetical protein
MFFIFTVGYTMARAWIFNIKTLIIFYILIFLELTVAVIEESFYWSIQNEANEVCHISSVIMWGDVNDCWWVPAFGVLLLETIYYWLHVYNKTQIKHSSQLKLYGFIFIIFLVPFILPIFGILPNLVSTIGYFIYKVRLAVILTKGTSKMEAVDVTCDKLALREEVRKFASLEEEARPISKQKIAVLQERVELNRNEANIMTNFTNNKGVRDIFFIFGVLYYGIALILERVWYDSNNISDPVFLNTVCKFILRWSTSVVLILTLSNCLIFIERIVTCLPVWFVSLETTFIDAINIQIDSNIAHFTFCTLLIESGIPSSDTDFDLKAIMIIVVIFFYFILQKAIIIPGRKILEISNRGSVLTIWFYLRVFIVFLVMVVVPLTLFASFASELCQEKWLLFFSSGSIILISNVMFFAFEWVFVSLTWYTDRYIPALERSIQYTNTAKECSYIILLPLQFYSRYTLSAFRAWWVLRAGNLILNYVALLIFFISQRKKEYDYNKTVLLLFNSLSDVSYASLNEVDHLDHTCSICFASIRDGKELPCMHVFHAECLRRWFKVRTVCPTCNLSLA